ncbi:alpha/beta fold hydrolase [Massilia endophytica]|uniref:alpha/beta fold hydrolase n=1 Tax=Massilia endophytica TaxID=2899220 RepID=UPI001E34E730|nr:alpha/beta hydrolase [Massilia endophytica]UGQ46301.1 alpha/beta hydrolase [Massilia endophytica]
MQRLSGRNRNLLLAAGALTAAYLVVRSKTRQVEAEHPPSGKFIAVNGLRLHYQERGSGPAVVLLHGNGATSQDFRLSGLFDQLAYEHRVIAIDRPGFGYSERPRDKIWTPEAQAAVLAEALRLLDVRQAIVLGHSWGAMVALAMGLDHPGLVRGLVLLSGYYYPSMRMDVALSAPALPVVGDLLSHTLAPLLSRAMWPALTRRVFSPRPVDAAFRRWPKWMSLRPKQLRVEAAETALMIPSAARLHERYGSLTMPVAIFTGDGDKMISPSHQAERLHRELEQSELHVVPHTGHMVHYVAQDAIAAAVRSITEQRPGIDYPQPASTEEPRTLH